MERDLIQAKELVHENLDKFLERYKEKIIKIVKKDFEKRFGVLNRVKVKGIWASKLKNEDKICIEYLGKDIGNRQIEITFKQANDLIEELKKKV